MKHITKNMLKISILSVLGAVCSLLLASHSMALPYQILHPVVIMTEATGDSHDPGPDNLAEWTVIPEKNNAGEMSLSFYLADNNQQICRLMVSDSENRIQWNNTTRIPQAMTQNDLFIVPGVNVPCDLLPITHILDRQDAEIFEVRRSVGGQTFVDRVKVETFEVGFGDAVQKGWLPADAPAPDKLVLVRAINLRMNTLLVQQLWIPGDDWWEYEETLNRKSWRVR